MSIVLISSCDDITINETLKDNQTIYEYITKVIDTLGPDVSIVLEVVLTDKLIKIKLK